jgi:hypothetical protein
VLLSRKKNSEAQNYDFETKKAKYFTSEKGVTSFALTSQVLAQSEWTPALLQSRQHSLLEKLRDLWSLEEWDAEDGEHGEDSSETTPTPKTDNKIPERYDIRKKFWAGLLEAAKQKTQLHANRSPGQHGWIGAVSGRRGMGFNYAVREHETQVELYIYRGTGAEAENKVIFDQLFAQKPAIEQAFGDDLEWQRLEGKQACRIRKVIQLGGWRDAEKWPAVHAAAAEAMFRLEKALKPAIAALSV